MPLNVCCCRAERAGLILSTDLPASLPDIFVDAERLELAGEPHPQRHQIHLPGGKITCARSSRVGNILSGRRYRRGNAPEEQLRIFERFFKI